MKKFIIVIAFLLASRIVFGSDSGEADPAQCQQICARLKEQSARCRRLDPQRACNEAFDLRTRYARLQCPERCRE